ncbi:MAG: hypothetical protein GY943_04700 [Chloroflexi bacterium]|nr:hypothetical protein [Chloroflexota bacterium]
MENFSLGIFVFIIPGALFLANGIRMFRGGSKEWYFSITPYSAATSYSQIPIGLAILSTSLGAMFQSEIFFWIAAGFVFIALAFNFWRPFFLKPAWLKHLVDEYGDFVHILAYEAREMDLYVWTHQMQTQVDLDEWAQQVWDKYSAEYEQMQTNTEEPED